MIAGLKELHDVLPREEQGNRQQPAAQGLAQDQAVGAHILVLAVEQFPRTSQPGLDLVDEQQHVMRPADLGAARQVAGRRHDDPALALDGFYQEGRGVGVNGLVQGLGVAERDAPETGRERSESVPVLRDGGEADDGDGATMEVIVANDDLGAVLRHPLDPVGPFAGGLERGFHRLGAGVHRQTHVHAGQLAGALHERREPVGMEGARDHGEAGRLPGQGLYQARMRVAVADGGVCTHHVQIAPALHVE